MNANEEMIAYSRYKQIGDENVYLMEKVRQQQAEIEKLGGELDRIVELYTDKAIENEALKELLANEGIVVGHDYLNNWSEK